MFSIALTLHRPTQTRRHAASFHQKHRLVLITTTLVYFLSGCALQSVKLTPSANVHEPHMAWNGKEFGIVYYDRSAPGSKLTIRAVTVDMKGKITNGPKKIATLAGSYTPGHLSELVWNPDRQKFAFEYSEGYMQHFVCLKPNMDVIKIVDNSYALILAKPCHLSLVYNTKLKKYGLTAFIYRVGKQPSIQFSEFTQHPMWDHGRSLVNCSYSGSEHTSLSYNSKTGEYAVAYYDGNKPKISFFKSRMGQPATFALSTASGLPEAIGLAYDQTSDSYAVATIGYAGELEYKIVNPTAPGSGTWFNQGKGHDNDFTLSKYWHTGHLFLLCTSQYNQIRCWAVNEKGAVKPDIVDISPLAKSFAHQPSAVAVGLEIAIAWVQDEALYFGRPILKGAE